MPFGGTTLFLFQLQWNSNLHVQIIVHVNYCSIGTKKFLLPFCCLFVPYNVQFQKKSILTHGRSLEIPRGEGGDLKVKILEQSMKLNWNFLGGREVQNKKCSMGGVWIFPGTTQCTFFYLPMRLQVWNDYWKKMLSV